MTTEKSIREAYLYLRLNNTIPDEVLQFMLDASLEKLWEIQDNQKKKEKMINIGDFIMVPDMGCTIYKVTEIIICDDGTRRVLGKTPLKIMPNSRIKELQFGYQDFTELEAKKIENW